MISAAQSQSEPFYIGTYGKASENQGIWRATLDTKTGKLSKPVLAAAADNAGFVAITRITNTFTRRWKAAMPRWRQHTRSRRTANSP